MGRLSRMYKDCSRGLAEAAEAVKLERERWLGARAGRVLSMRLSLMCAVVPLMAFAVMAGSTKAVAIPLTPFRYEAQAQRYCPDDTVVWLDFRKGIYYSKRQKNHYAQGSTGSFVCRKEARNGGYRRSLLGLR